MMSSSVSDDNPLAGGVAPVEIPPLTAVNPSLLSSCSYHAYRRPDISFKLVHAVGLMAHCHGAPIPLDWEASCSTILQSCASFHEAQFPGSRVSWSLHGAIEIPVSETDLGEGDEAASNAFYNTANAGVRHLSGHVGALPSPVLRGGVIWPDDEAPTAVIWCVFAAWGSENMRSADEAEWKKYFISASAKPIATTDIPSFLLSKGALRAGGSRASFLGTVTLESARGLWSSLGIKQTSMAISPSSSVNTIGVGVGVVTVEAWVVPTALGSDIVAYHEAFGHGLNLPHPSARDSQCVMSHAQYSNIPLSSAIVCDEIKTHCGLPSAATTATTTAKNTTSPPPVILRFQIPNEGEATVTVPSNKLNIDDDDVPPVLLCLTDDTASTASTVKLTRALLRLLCVSDILLEGHKIDDDDDDDVSKHTILTGIKAAPTLVYSFSHLDDEAWAVGEERTFLRRRGFLSTNPPPIDVVISPVTTATSATATATATATAAAAVGVSCVCGNQIEPFAKAAVNISRPTETVPMEVEADEEAPITLTPPLSTTLYIDWGLSGINGDISFNKEREIEARKLWQIDCVRICEEAQHTRQSHKDVPIITHTIDIATGREWIETIIRRESIYEFSSMTAYSFKEISCSGPFGIKALEMTLSHLASSGICSNCLNGYSDDPDIHTSDVFDSPILFEAASALPSIEAELLTCQRSILLLDQSRNIAIGLPIASNSAVSILGMSGVTGTFCKFQQGQWASV